MLFLIWALLSIAIIFSFDLLSFGLGRRGWQRFFSTFFFFYAQIMLTEFVLGLLTILTGSVLMVVNVLVTTTVLFLIQRVYGKKIFRAYTTGILQAARQWLKETRRDPLFLALLILAIVLVSWIIFLGVLFPVTDVDGNAYHMSFIAQVMQNHSIYDVPTSIPWLAGYPKGGELMEMWSVITTRNDTFADLSQAPFLLLGVVSLYAIALRLGVKKTDAKFASLLWLFIPVVINQAKTTYVDVIFCALFFAALAMVTKIKPTKLDLVITGIIFSLLMSVKSTGALFVLACLPFLLFSLGIFNNRNVLTSLKKNTTNLLIIAAPLLFGLYWYVKDFISYGTPLYPFGLKVLGVSIFPGNNFQEFIAGAFSNFSVMPDGLFHRLWFVWTEQKDWFGCLYNYDSTFSGLGPVWFTLLIPSIVIATIIAIRRRNYLLLSLSVVIGLVFLLYPANYYSRYTIFIVLVGVVSFGLVSTVLGGTLRTLARLTAIWLSFIVIATTFTLCNFTPQFIRNQKDSINAGDARASLAYHYAVGDAYLYVQRNIMAGGTVAYDSSAYLVYPLWKPDFSNKVVYLPAHTSSEWYKKVASNHVKYIFTELTSKEHKWARTNQAYSSVYKDHLYEVYKVY